MERLFKGCYGIVMTPFLDNGKVDFRTLENHIRTLGESSITGFIACGSTGEFSRLTPEENVDLMKCVHDANEGRKQFLCGATAPDTYTTNKYIEEISRIGADGMLIAPPYYFPMSDEEVVAFYDDISRNNVAKVPIVAYNIPQCTTPISVKAFEHIIQLEDVKGMKNSWMNLCEIMAMISLRDKYRPDMSMLTGLDACLGADIDLNPGWDAGAENFTVPENVWTPIVGFAGIFDGAGHTIRGLCTTNTTGISGIGLFTQVDGATIKNLTVENSYLTGNTSLGVGIIGQGSGTFKNIKSDMTINITGSGVGNVGGILGLATGEVSVDTCMSSSTIISNRKRVGGIVGSCNGNKVTIAHCLNTGNLTFTNSEDIGMMGGILGLACLLNADTNDFTGLGTISIEDCMSTGAVISYGVKDNTKSTSIGGIIGVLDNGNGKEAVKAPVTITSTYYVQHENDDADKKAANTIVGLRSKLNATNIGVGSLSDMTGIISYSNARYLDWYDASNNTDGHWVVQKTGTPILKQFADAEQVFDTSGMNQDQFVLVNNVGYIPNSSILKNFANQMSAGTLVTDANTKVYVLADIDMNPGWVAANKTAPDYVWKQIKGFSGTFDGQGHTISGLYVTNADGVNGIGMFTEVSGATIQNLRVTNSYFTGNTSLGTGIIGQGSGTFQNIYADVVIGISGGTTAAGNVGGILGLATGNTTISDCWSNCTITSTRKRIGGIVGYCGGYEVTISHCLNTGNLSYIGDDKGYIGGILGLACLVNNGSFEGVGSVTVEDCLTTGCVISNKTTDNTIGGVIGCVGNGSGTGTGVAPVTLSTSYFLQHTISNTSVVTATKLSGAYSGISPVNCGKATTLASLKGDSAKTTAKNLDWYDATSNTDGYWITREEEIPILKIMEDVTE